MHKVRCAALRDDELQAARRIDLQTRPAGKIRRARSETLRRHASIAVVQDFEASTAKRAAYDASWPGQKDPASSQVAFMAKDWHYGVVQRYDCSWDPVEIHVVRLGDLVVCTNPFELYCEYGIRIKARSPATQTFIVQMSGFGSYLPTERAQVAGGYSAIPQSSIIGPAGGQLLVDKTVDIVNGLFSAQ